MALTVTAAEVPGKWAVRLQASGATGTVTWFRDQSGRETLIGDGADVVDRYVPLNTACTWIAVDDTDTEVTATVTVASDHPILSSSMFGTASRVTIIAQTPNRWAGRSVWHPVIDKDDGPVVSVFSAEWRNGTLVLDLPDRATRSELLHMLMAGDPLILRAPCPDRVDDLTILPTGWSDPYQPEGQFKSQRLTIDYQAVTPEPPAWTPPPNWTYQDALNAHATYSEWLGAYGTYGDLLAGIP
jgi:hypothetical protein